MSTAAPALAARVGERVKWQSKIYNAVVTPVTFVTFLISLYLVDNQYRAQRRHEHEVNERPWMHRLLFRRRDSPYEWVESHQGQSSSQSANTTRRHTKNADDSPRLTKEAGSTWYYHTKQKKLFKREAADAFALRHWVLVALCFLIVLGSWVLWRMMVWLIA